jgi:hypothetical protein
MTFLRPAGFFLNLSFAHLSAHRGKVRRILKWPAFSRSRFGADHLWRFVFLLLVLFLALPAQRTRNQRISVLVA